MDAVLGAVVGGAALVFGAPMALTAAGFTATGVATGSAAAAVQSVVYGGATTGAFSVLQSVGAAGIGAAGNAGIGAVGAVVGAAAGGN